MQNIEINDDSLLVIMDKINKWHNTNQRVFRLETDSGATNYLAIKLAYHNYQMWHLIEDYNQPDLKDALFYFNGGKEQNTFRNETIDKIDSYIHNTYCQKEFPQYNSESLGSILDRFSIIYIKELHTANRDTISNKYQICVQERIFLKDMFYFLFNALRCGTIGIRYFPRFKIDYHQ